MRRTLKGRPSNVKMGHFMHKHDLTRYLRVVGHAHSADVVVSSGGNFSGTPRSMAEAKKTYSVFYQLSINIISKICRFVLKTFSIEAFFCVLFWSKRSRIKQMNFRLRKLEHRFFGIKNFSIFQKLQECILIFVQQTILRCGIEKDVSSMFLHLTLI